MFSAIGHFFEIIFYQPIFNALVLIYNTVGDLGITIIIITLLIKGILYPFSKKTLKAQHALQQLQPKLQALQKQYKDKKEELARATMALYKKEKVSPFSSCLPLLIQLPFLIAVFRVFREGFKSETLDLVYPFIMRPETINPMVFGIVDLSQPSIPIAVLAGLAQFWQTRMMIHTKQPKVDGSEDESMTAMMNKQVMYVMPLVTVIIGASLPGGLSLYWLMFTLLTVAQQYFVFKENEDSTEDKDNNNEKNKLQEAA